MKYGKCIPTCKATSMDNNASISLHNKFAPLNEIAGADIYALNVPKEKNDQNDACVLKQHFQERKTVASGSNREQVFAQKGKMCFSGQ